MTLALAGRPVRSRVQRPAKFRPGKPARRRFRRSRGDLVGRPDPGRSSSAGPEHMFWLVNYSLNLGFAQSWDFAQSCAVERMFRTYVPNWCPRTRVRWVCSGRRPWTTTPWELRPTKGAAWELRQGAAFARTWELHRAGLGSCAGGCEGAALLSCQGAVSGPRPGAASVGATPAPVKFSLGSCKTYGSCVTAAAKPLQTSGSCNKRHETQRPLPKFDILCQISYALTKNLTRCVKFSPWRQRFIPK